MLTAALAIVVCTVTLVILRLYGKSSFSFLSKLHVAFTTYLHPISSMGEEIEIPTPEEQKEILSRKLAKSVIKGETWYLISVKWLKSLKQFIKMIPDGGYVCQPGPVDNRPILTDDLKDLRKQMAESYDYEIISSECWNLLTTWYGLIPEQTPIARKAIQSGKNYVMVEVYLIELKCYKNFDSGSEKKIKVSRADLISTVHNNLRHLFDVPESINSRLWMSYSEDNYDLLNLDVSVQDSGLTDNQCVILEVQHKDTWPYNGKVSNNSASYQNPAQPSTSRNHLNYRSLRNSRSNSSHRANYALKLLPGVCGLTNPGLTCFINSVIQCLSHSPPLTEYFLNNEHMKEINVTNPLGMKGEMAKAYGELMHTMWSGRVTTINPVQVKMQVSKFNPQFFHQQHDAQEHLTFLLDGLHEDLNRIIKKPYIENKVYTGQEDNVVAKESWENYKRRNDSIVVDTFHGLLKSRVVCPQCERLSVTFDPFCTLSLPLPLKKERFLKVKVRFIPYDPVQRECLYRVLLPRKGLVKDLCQEIGEKTKTNPHLLVVADITNSHFHKFYSQEETLDSIEDKDSIYIYEMTEKAYDPDFIIVPICFWELCQPNDKFSQNHLFGIPFLVILPKDDLRLNQIGQAILYHMRRHFTLPDSLNFMEGHCRFNFIYSPNLYLFDTGVIYKHPLKLEFDENGFCLNDLTELLEAHDPDRVFGRKIIIVQLTVDERRDYFSEMPADYGSDLNLSRSNPRGRDKLMIYDCLDLFTTCEKLGEQNAWYCPKCKKHQRPTKKFDFWKLPKVLILHLKRFSFNRAGDKIDTLVEYPINDLNLSKYVINPEEQNLSYDLIGVINHTGSVSAGHYTAFCKNKENNTWYCFNDDVVTPLKANEIMSQTAYLLFYYRNDSYSPPPTPMDVN